MAAIGVNLSEEENNLIEEWQQCGVIVKKYFTYEHDNTFYEIEVDTEAHSSDGCSYHFDSVCGGVVIVNIFTIIKNPSYFTKIEKTI